MPEVLTPDDSIEKLTGRELDVAMAERVMQWSRRDYDDGCYYFETYFSAYNDGGQIVVFRDGSQRKAVRWSPAQNIEAAMEVVEKMREHYSNVSIHAANGWGVSFGRITCKRNDPDSFIETWTPVVNADTLPVAICRAALKAVGAE